MKGSRTWLIFWNGTSDNSGRLTDLAGRGASRLRGQQSRNVISLRPAEGISDQKSVLLESRLEIKIKKETQNKEHENIGKQIMKGITNYEYYEGNSAEIF